MSSLRATLLSTTNKWVQAHQSYDMATVATLRTPTCTYPRLPKSLNLPVFNNEEWDAFFPTTQKLFATHDINIYETMVDEERRKVILMTRETGESPGGVKFENEMIFVITLNEDGRLVEEHVGFVDSAAMVGYMRAIGVIGATEGS